MKYKAIWPWCAATPFGPLVGWLVHNHFYTDSTHFLGMGVMIAWTGVCISRIVMHTVELEAKDRGENQ